jgi:hypothetical protein
MKLGDGVAINGIFVACVVPLVSLTLILVSPDAMITVLWATLGLGIVLLPLPTLTAYVLCFLPAALTVDGRRWPFIILSVATLVLTAFLPSHFGKKQAQKILAETKQAVFSSETAARTLEIEIAKENIEGFHLPPSTCAAECNVLLKSGQLDWVRISTRDGNQSKKYAYRAGIGQACASPGFPVSNSTRCVFPIPVPTDAADYRIHITIDQLGDFRKIPDLNDWAIVEGRLNVLGYKNGEKEPTYAQQQLDIEVPVMPTVIFARVNSASDSGGINLYRTRERYNPLSWKRVFSDLGYQIGEAELSIEKDLLIQNWDKGLTPELNKQLVAILDLSQTSVFNAAQAGVIQQWTTHARAQKNWNSELIALAVRLASDERIQSFTDIDGVFHSNDEVTKALIPVVLNRLERTADTKNHSDFTSIVRWQFPRLKPELLYPYAEQITKLSERPGKMGHWFIPSLGRIGIDPSPMLLPFRNNNSDGVPFLKIIAACHAEQKWSSVLVPELKKALLETRIKTSIDTYSDYDRRHREILIAALVAHNETEFVSSLLPVRHKQRNNLESLTKAIQKNGQPECRD